MKQTIPLWKLIVALESASIWSKTAWANTSMQRSTLDVKSNIGK